MENLPYGIINAGSQVFLFIVIILLSKLTNDFLTPYRIDDELTNQDNLALAVSICGYLAATAVIFIGALLGPSKGWIKDLLNVGGYSIFGIILLNVSRFINDKLILFKFNNVKEIIEDRNTGTGAVQFGSYMASGLIIAGAVHGEGGGMLTVLVFFSLGQAALIAFTWLYNLITAYDIHKEIEADNVAAGVAFGGTLVSVGILLMKGASGNFTGWAHNLGVFGISCALVFIMIPVIRLFFDKLIIPKSDLNKEIKSDRNLGAGLLEAVVSMSFATVLFFTMP